MKIRSGFVSNSSSTSFCIIGTTLFLGQLAEAEGLLFRGIEHKAKINKLRGCEHPEQDSRYCPECGTPMWREETAELEYDELYYGCNKGEVLTFYGDYELECAGVNAKELLEGLSIAEAKVHFREFVRDRLKVDIPLKAIDLHYGKSGDG